MRSDEPPRIAVAGISIECSTFSPAVTDYDGFTHYRGEEIVHLFSFLQDEPDVVPLQWSRSMPGAPVTGHAYTRIKREILQQVEGGGPWDGVYLIMHGAMSVVGMEDAEADFVADLRESVGRDCLVVASYDLHGNMSRRIFDNVDLITAYRHAPHIDAEETRRRGFELLFRCLSLDRLPEKKYIRLPMLLPGEKTSTEWEPAMSLYRPLDTVSSSPGIIDASILIGYAWADEARSGASVLVYGDDLGEVSTLCTTIASRFWELRTDFAFGVPSGSFIECLDMAAKDLADGVSPVIISDSGDNPTAGGTGDVTDSLAKLLDSAPVDSVFASIHDAAAVDRCFYSSAGCAIGLILGGKMDAVHGTPLAVSGTILYLSDSDPWNRKVVLECGNVKVIITEKRTPYHHLDQFRELQIEPLECDLLVVKIGYLVPELRLLALSAYLAISPGAVNQDIQALPYRNVQRPIFPLDAMSELLALGSEGDLNESLGDV